MNTSKTGSYLINTKDKRISAEEMERLLDQSDLLDEIIPLMPAGFNPDHKHIDIADIACGPGGWALQVAQQHPSAEVVGVDEDQRMLAYAQAQAQSRDCPNARFQYMNILEPLTFPDAFFDLVNVRLVGLVVPATMWSAFVRELYRVTKPGGMVRLTEIVASDIAECPIANYVQDLFFRIARKTGKSFADARFGWSPMLGKFERDAGYIDIVETPYAFNFSAGHPLHDAMSSDIKRTIPLLEKSGMLSEVENVDAMYQQMCAEFDSDDFCAISYMLSATGRKPA